MADRTMRGRVGALAMVGTTFLLFDRGSPAPSPCPQKMVLTVRVLERGNEWTIPGATIRVNRIDEGVTDRLGRLAIGVVAGEALSVDVSAEGYIGFGADGTIANDETWTFYLEREGRPGQ